MAVVAIARRSGRYEVVVWAGSCSFTYDLVNNPTAVIGGKEDGLTGGRGGLRA